jgi:hypothetical protein
MRPGENAGRQKDINTAEIYLYKFPKGGAEIFFSKGGLFFSQKEQSPF